ncbi:hypothetical protein PsorP6_002585 [Peronosclerospora sorghi]|uniref:Uncharacterized protein n=1 Tax=Peronosclerospora sorghi TaxID=230839 RepID=A0ACC0WSL8_9STRA|nr:hypothetical protein PsorP6_002585 [Peronosclerospora sorghi]
MHWGDSKHAGVPCSNVIHKILATPPGKLTLDLFHEHWHLTKNVADIESLISPQAHIGAILRQIETRHSHIPPHQQRMMQAQLAVLAQEQPLEQVQKPASVRTRGRPTKSDNSTRRDPSAFELVDKVISKNKRCVRCRLLGNNIRSFPSSLAEDLVICAPPTLNADALKPSLQVCLQNVIHSVPDGNCGYRSIAYFTKGDQEAYYLVPDDAILAATVYQRAVVIVTDTIYGSATYLPATGSTIRHLDPVIVALLMATIFNLLSRNGHTLPDGDPGSKRQHQQAGTWDAWVSLLQAPMLRWKAQCEKVEDQECIDLT